MLPWCSLSALFGGEALVEFRLRLPAHTIIGTGQETHRTGAGAVDEDWGGRDADLHEASHAQCLGEQELLNSLERNTPPTISRMRIVAAGARVPKRKSGVFISISRFLGE